MRAVRTAHFTDCYPPRRDGVATSVHTLVTAQRGTGQPTLLVAPAQRGLPTSGEVLAMPSLPGGPAGVRLARWPRRRQLDRIRAFGPDVVHVHTPGPAGLLGVWAARSLGVPLVYTYHTNLHAGARLYGIPGWFLAAGVRAYARRLGVPAPRRAGPPVDRLLRLLLADAAAVLVPSRAVLDRDPLPVPAERLRVVCSGVRRRQVPAGAGARFRRRYRIDAAAPVVLFVGRVGPEKNVPLAIEAFARVRAALPAARLVLVGTVLRRRRLRRWLDAAGVRDAVVSTGELGPDEVAAGYAAADVLVVPCRYETQGLVVAEAAWQGVPAVLADPVLAAGDPLAATAVLAPADPDGYAGAITGLLGDRQRYRRVAAAARAAAEGYRTDRYADAVLGVYRQLCDRTAVTLG